MCRYRDSHLLLCVFAPPSWSLLLPISMGRDSLSSSARIAGEVPHPTRQRRDFRCPKQDREGASLSSHGFTTISINGSSGTTALTCTYDDGAGECTYSEDGIFQSGLSACPGGAEEPTQPASTTPATTETQTETQTQTKTVTQITDPLPSTSTSTIPILSPLPSSTSSASPSSQPPPSTFSSSSAAQSLPAVSSSSVVPTSQTSSTSLPFVDQTAHASSKSLAAGAIVGHHHRRTLSRTSRHPRSMCPASSENTARLRVCPRARILHNRQPRSEPGFQPS
ncbi:hypothetical protein B0H14DRAFT_377855 [Mycena olivaceomarginata]|nr:hypothetical protein B0H14DRAFT_377855 [Mycena olivaceomarginata]